MRIEQLEYVEAVARLGSFRRAAEELHLSQPALSETVRNLERELGVELLDRTRTGVRLSAEGQDVYAHLLTVLDAVDALRRAADERQATSRMVRLGTVNAATFTLVTPAISAFREAHPATQVEVIGAQQRDIQRAVTEGSLDLGLITCLDSDDQPPALETVELLRGRAVVCMLADSPLASQPHVSIDDLLGEALIVMRAGYLMHRLLHRLLGGRTPSFSYSTDGAEMGKLMVAQGLGVTLLPDFSIVEDPLERRGVITYRPLENRPPDVLLAVQRRRSSSTPVAAQGLHDILVRQARAYDGAELVA